MTPPRGPLSNAIFPVQALDAVSSLRQGLTGSSANPTSGQPVANQPDATQSGTASASPAAAKPPATETIARRLGATIDEVDFPGFVAGLVHGTFDAIVDASIRQMESFGSLVSAVAKTVNQFTEENVTPNQARDWLAQRYPAEVRLILPGAEGGQPHLEARTAGQSPAWLADFKLEGTELTAELLEETLLPQVRGRIGADRQQLLATMVMLGMNRVAVRDGTISAKVQFRAAAQDVSQVGFATGSDPQSAANWGERGRLGGGGATTMVSTLAVNAQSESNIRADLFGEVKLNFVSETLPLEKLADAARIALVQRNSPVARSAQGAVGAPAPTPVSDRATPGYPSP